MKKQFIWVAIICAASLTPAVALVVDGLTDEVAPSDVTIVLGNQVFPDGTPSPRLAARLDRALDLHRSGTVHTLLVSGGTGAEGVPEGDAMKQYLVRRGVPETAILVDNAGVDTWATARNAERTLRANDLSTAIVVSQHFHLPRTRLAFARHGMEVGTAHARFFEWRDIYSTAREIPAYVKYVLRPVSEETRP